MNRTAKLLLVGTVLAAASWQASACYTVYDRQGRVAYQGDDAPVDMSLPLHVGLNQRFPGAHMVFAQGGDCPRVGIGALARPQGGAVPPNTAVMGAGASTKTAHVASLAAPHTATIGAGSAVNTAVMGAGPAPNTAVMGAGRAPNTAVMGAGPAAGTPTARRASGTAVTGAAPARTAQAARSTAYESRSPLLTDKSTAVALGLPYRDLGDGVVVVPATAASRVALNTMTVVPAAERAGGVPNTATMGAGPGPNTATMGAGPGSNTAVMGAGPAGGAETVITEMRDPPVTVIQRGSSVRVER